MADETMSLDDFGEGQLASDIPVEVEEKIASDLAPVFDVPVNISAVLGRTHLSVSLVARGEVVIVDDRLGVTMTEIIKDGDANA